MATLKGTPNTKIATPFGLITLNRNGTANLSDEQARYIKERIELVFLPNYTVIEDKKIKKDPPE